MTSSSHTRKLKSSGPSPMEFAGISMNMHGEHTSTRSRAWTTPNLECFHPRQKTNRREHMLLQHHSSAHSTCIMSHRFDAKAELPHIIMWCHVFSLPIQRPLCGTTPWSTGRFNAQKHATLKFEPSTGFKSSSLTPFCSISSSFFFLWWLCAARQACCLAQFPCIGCLLAHPHELACYSWATRSLVACVELSLRRCQPDRPTLARLSLGRHTCSLDGFAVDTVVPWLPFR